MASSILFDQSKLKAYDGLARLCEYAGESEEWCGLLWQELLGDPELYEAFVHYLERHELPDRPRCEGYSLTDCYVWQMEQDNLRRDTGKNTAQCNKEEMVLRAFMTMTQLRKTPEEAVRKLSDWKGMDQIM